jgi:hypothetical protein
MVSVPRSLLLRRVLWCLRDHPHDTTPGRMAARLGDVGEAEVEVALRALAQDALVVTAQGHWQLARAGWRAAGPAPAD